MHKAYWALKNSNMYLDVASEQRLLQLNEFNEPRLITYKMPNCTHKRQNIGMTKNFKPTS